MLSAMRKSAFVLIVILGLLILALSAGGAQRWVIDFESDSGLWQLPPQKDMGGVKVAIITDGALDGSKSLSGDSMGLDTMWHEILHTSGKVKFKPNTRYYVNMQAKIADIDLGERSKRPAFYYMMRSRSIGVNDSVDLYSQFWMREKGYQTEIGTVFTTKKGVNDYYLNVGIRDSGKLIIDNITITEIEGNTPAYGKALKPLPADTNPAWDILRKHREHHNLAQTLDEMTVVGIFEGCNGTMNEVMDFMNAYVKPDALDWAPMPPTEARNTATLCGSWFTTSRIEYQEHYKVEEPELWDKRWEIFPDSGMMHTMSGQINFWEVFGEGGYYMCHNGKTWREYFDKVTVPLVNMSQGICEDNIGVPPFTSAKGCFCENCLELFRKHLASIYSSEELKKFGINDLSTFSFRTYALENGLNEDNALTDALAKEYIRFQNLTHRDKWLGHAAAFKAEADKTDHAISTSGNQIFMTGPYAIALSPTNDIIEVERLENLGDYKVPNISVAYKIGRASGYNERPVWFRGTDTIGKGELNTSAMALEAQYGEAEASGCIRTIFMPNDWWPSMKVTNATTRIPKIRDMTAGLAKLLRENRAIYSHRESMAKVAMVYSQPTMVWNNFWAFNYMDYGKVDAFQKVSNALDTNHVPHDVLILGYPGLWDDAWSLKRMSRYKALVIPDADCLTDAHVLALIQYAKNGGKLYLGNNTAQFNENREKRSVNSINELLALGRQFNNTSKTITEISRQYGLVTDAPGQLIMNPWLSADGHAVALHIVNYNVDAKADTVTTPGKVTVDIPLPQGRKTPFDSVYLLTTSGAQRTPEVSCDFKHQTAHAQFTLNRPYGVLVLADSDQLAKKEAEIRARRAKISGELRQYNEEHLIWPPKEGYH